MREFHSPSGHSLSFNTLSRGQRSCLVRRCHMRSSSFAFLSGEGSRGISLLVQIGCLCAPSLVFFEIIATMRHIVVCSGHCPGILSRRIVVFSFLGNSLSDENRCFPPCIFSVFSRWDAFS